MKTSISRCIGGVIVISAFLIGCATTDDTTGNDIPMLPEQSTTDDTSSPAEEAPIDESPAVEDEAVDVDEKEIPAPEAVDPLADPDEIEEAEPIEVSEELYEQTFTEVEATIEELNEIISERNFMEWQQYLTDDYRRTYSDPDVLEQNSQSTVLMRNNITLNTLEDYFNFVVVPSRSNARLDDLVFLDEETVEAIMEVGERRYLLYLLKKTGNRWKIDTF